MGPIYSYQNENFELAMKCIKNSQHQKELKEQEILALKLFGSNKK